MNKTTIAAIILILGIIFFLVKMSSITLREEIDKGSTKTTCQKDSKGNEICFEIE